MDTTLSEIKDDLAILDTWLSGPSDLRSMNQKNLKEFGAQFLVTMITLEGLLDEVYDAYFSKQNVPDGDITSFILAEFVHIQRLTEQEAAHIFDAMALAFYFSVVPSWSDLYPDVPAFVGDSLLSMKDYYGTLKKLIGVVDELKGDTA